VNKTLVNLTQVAVFMQLDIAIEVKSKC